MQKVSAVEAKRHLGQLIKRAQAAPILVTRRGQPAGIVLSPQDFYALRDGGEFSSDVVRQQLEEFRDEHTAR